MFGLEKKHWIENICNDWIAIWHAWMTTCKWSKNTPHTCIFTRSLNVNLVATYRTGTYDVQEWMLLQENHKICTRTLITVDAAMCICMCEKVISHFLCFVFFFWRKSVEPITWLVNWVVLIARLASFPPFDSKSKCVIIECNSGMFDALCLRTAK